MTQGSANGKGNHRPRRVIQTGDRDFFVSCDGKSFFRVQGLNGSKSCTCTDFVSNTRQNPQYTCEHILQVENAKSGVEQTFEKVRPKLDDRFVTTVQGKEFVVYAGILDLAHQRGLKGIEVEAVQYPTKDNGMEAICKAIVESESGEVFVEWGDANPRNVNPKIAAHILRMAATRAKARALRDFTNIGMTCLEEIRDVDEVLDDGPIRQGRSRRETSTKESGKSTQGAPTTQAGKTAQSAASNGPPQVVRENGPAEVTKPTNGNGNGDAHSDSIPKPSSAQMRAIENLAKRRNMSSEELDEVIQQQYGTGISNITASEASSLIRSLQQSA